MGRHLLLNEDLALQLLEGIRAGACAHVAAEAAGISRRSFFRWLERGENGEEPYATFLAEVQQAKAVARQDAENRLFKKDPDRVALLMSLDQGRLCESTLWRRVPIYGLQPTI